MTILRPGKTPEEREVDLPPKPGYVALKALLTPLLDGGEIEHVYVSWVGKTSDMFVDDMGHRKGLPRNNIATDIYRYYALRRPGTNPDFLPFIVGPAILFNRRVWF